jgi:GNAT superfamily N-acetyltransferase
MNSRITLDNLDETIAFRFADVNDIPELMGLYERFYEEAVYKDFLKFDLERARNTILHGITMSERPHILALDHDDVIVGFLAYILDHSFSVRPCQVLMEFYVVPEYRRGAIGRALLTFAVEEGRRANAGAFHAPVASGMNAARSMFNMFEKAGFSPLGFVMRKGL